MNNILINMIIRVLLSLVMFTVSFSYVYSYKNKKFRVNSWRKIGGIILMVISIAYLIYSFKGVLF
ncbi:hypothetical protein LOOC260_107440 [Paucilactobacillus hokkaidonensis JCM 18461]|uniref:Uncharacterized protein n=1 Tax=Paucilactobacillus hokkaidonensis JCM 18461 TaxID=1291742 RepID=A0A0A1GW69_9LACO|nr:hypothetical protein LOOC260_107440 [Paucilactobacillus hokkaidonensis JCM 18461]